MPVRAEGAQKTVKVGWYESPFNTTDKNGRLSGYAYEYQLKIASYSGWKYTYISGSWYDLMQKLISGEIDLMSDVSYTEARAEQMLFSELTMGTEEYCIFISPDNKNITAEDFSTFNGKKIGVNKDSIQVGFYREWAEEHDVHAELVEMKTTEVKAVEMLEDGEIDAYITLNAYGDPDALVPVCKIGYSDIYFAVSKNRPDLLSELNAAMSRIQDGDPYYNQQMFEKYVRQFGTNAFLTISERNWLSEHGAIRVGYQDNYLAFCSKDPVTGELMGALKDYLEYASDCLSNAHIDFTAQAYPTAAAALNALQRGEIDCLFPSNLSGYESETRHLIVTPAVMRSDVYTIIRQSDKDFFGNKEHVVVAVNEGNFNYDAFLADNFPKWRKVYYSTTADCLRAVSEGVADCVLVSNYRYNNIARLCDQYGLTAFSTGLGLDYCFAVYEGDTELYSVLDKVTGLVPTSTINAALSVYITEDARTTFSDFLIKNIGVVIVILAIMIAAILFFMLRSIFVEKKAKKLIAATELDELTGLYNRNFFFQRINKIYKEHPEIPRDAIVVNIEQFHTINALHGREFGDDILRTLGSEIEGIAKETGGVSGRFGADRFDLYCKSLDEYQTIFDRLQNKLNDFAPNASIRIRMGVMPWQDNVEPMQMFDRARAACSMARGHYKEHLIVFGEKMLEKELLEQRLLNDLRRALDNFEFEVYYQPQYDIQSKTPKLVSAEALVRWQHPELGMVYPDKFIPLFEKNGKIGELDKYVWDQAARQIARWKAAFGVAIPVSVNLSRIDIFDPMLEKTLDEIVMRNGLGNEMLHLEVTESAYTGNASQVVKIVGDLRKKGYVVEMDDFGTGYSSLNMLSAMPIDVLKMDRTFIHNIEKDERDVQLVALILGIAKNLHIPVVAEGVETETQMNMLHDLGCQMVQGYYFSRPLHPSEFEANILQNKKSN